MEFEYWWLLGFPIFFALGWLAARVDIKHLVKDSRALPSSYFKGLNFLLNEQPDKAIEAFIEVVKVDPETVELHFALGSLFRRRGEYDRAIRMHQHLLERADLGAEQRAAALFELGQDYLKAGILDRAEEVFQRLVDGKQAGEARRFLLEIYQQEKDWDKAAAMARQLEKETGESRARENVAFPLRAGRDRGHAFAAGHGAAPPGGGAGGEPQERARQPAAGRPGARLGSADRAIEHWKRIESQNPAFLALVAQRLLEAHREVGRLEEGLTLLTGYLERYPSLDLLDAVFQSTLESKGAEAAYKMVRDELRRNPTLLGLDRLLEAQIIGAANPSGGATWSWCATSCTATRAASRATAARTAASRRASSTGCARPAAAGRPIRRAVRKSSTSRHENHRGRHGYVGLVTGPASRTWATRCCAWTSMPPR
jgi:lipopolysaccharide biosynthesis regulator YciM